MYKTLNSYSLTYEHAVLRLRVDPMPWHVPVNQTKEVSRIQTKGYVIK